MKRIVILTTAFLILTATSSFAETATTQDINGIYARVDAGISMLTKKNAKSSLVFKDSALYSLGIGYHFNDLFRTDLNLQYRQLKLKDDSKRSLSNLSVLLNAYLNLTDSNDQVIPYLMAGIGYGSNKLSNFTTSATKDSDTWTINKKGIKTNNFLWNLGVGIRINLIEKANLDLSYRYLSLGNAKSQADCFSGVKHQKIPETIGSIRANEFTAGIIFKF
jgi:opacity protein-like surface antigen